MPEGNLCIILKSANYNDYDRMLTLLSQSEGRINAMAKGAKSLKSRLNAATQPFCCAEYEFYKKGSRNYIKSALIKEKFSDIQTKDINVYTAACAMLELTDKIAEYAENARRLFALLIYSLYALNEQGADYKSVLTYFFINIIYSLGIFPAFDFCTCCGEPAGDSLYWGAESGGRVCKNCASEIECASITPAVPAYFNAAIKLKPSDFIKAVKPDKIPFVFETVVNYLKYAGDIELKTLNLLK